jgi:Flp pilus assembly protein TadB
MNTTVLTSTFLLTLLLMVGLFFFVKASVKDRTQQIRLVAKQTTDSISDQLKQYFAQRAYQVTAADQESITFEGLVRPSVFLAVFLTLLVAVSLLCLALVLSALSPQVGIGSLLLSLLSPLAGWFYWQQAERPEQVFLKVESFSSNPDDSHQANQSLVTVTAHRDELIELQRALKLRNSPAEALRDGD